VLFLERFSSYKNIILNIFQIHLENFTSGVRFHETLKNPKFFSGFTSTFTVDN
jgi:hypothetical protein